MKKQYSLLIIDYEPGIIDAYGRYFKKHGFRGILDKTVRIEVYSQD